MNWKALRKTLIPSKQDLSTGLVGCLAGLLGLGVFVAVIFAIAFGIWWLLVWMFGATGAGYIVLGSIGLMWFYVLVIDPLITRYHRICNKLDDE